MTTDTSADRIRRAGAALAASRSSGEPLLALPGGLPRSVDEARAIQAAAIEAYGSDRVGYKIGATSDVAQSMLGLEHPFRAPLFATPGLSISRRSSGDQPGRATSDHDPDHGSVHDPDHDSDHDPDHDSVHDPDRDSVHDGARSSVCDMVLLEPSTGIVGIEAEFAFRLGTDLPPRSIDYTLADVRAAIDTAHPAIEVVGLRLPNELFADAGAVIADFGANVGFVPGEAVDSWGSYDLSTTAVTVTIDDTGVASGSGANVLGNPLNALVWLANDVRSSGGLHAGDWISTGACTGIVPMTAGQTVTTNFAAFGSVRLSVTH